jgi:hypothetical protein
MNFFEKFKHNSRDSNYLGGIRTIAELDPADYDEVLMRDDGTIHDIIMNTLDMNLPGSLNKPLKAMAQEAARVDPGRVIEVYGDSLKRSHNGRKILKRAKKYREKRKAKMTGITDPDSESIIGGYMGMRGNGSMAFDDCKNCSNDKEPFEHQPIDAKSVGVFMFEQDGKCWCYLVNNLYKSVFGTSIPNTIDNLSIKNDKNPLNGTPIDAKILQRLVAEYGEWYSTK